MVKVAEMPKRGPNKKLTKTRAIEIAKDILMDNLSVAYYSVSEGTDNPTDRYGLSDDEQELVYQMLRQLGQKMAKSIGREYYTV